jgi:Prp8 binding protein
MICTDYKYIYVYDEDNVEESKLLRKISGAHTEEITIIKYDNYLSLLATGSINGEVCVWDFEMSKIEGFCLGHTGDVTGIEFMAPYPLMVTASLDCSVRIWGVRPCNINYKYICLYNFKNYSWSYNKDTLVPVTKIFA